MGTDGGRDEPLWPAVLAQSADAIWMLDAEERIVGWNRGAEEMLGYRSEEIVGQPLSRLIPEDLLRSGEDRALAGVLEERGAITDYETRRRRKDGGEVQVSLSQTLIRARNGDVLGSVTVARDVSERKRMERQIIESEKLVSVGQVAASVAQEIGAPITALGLLIEQLRRDPQVTERYAEEIETIQGLLERVGRLTRQLVDLAKPRAPHLRAVDLKALVRETLALLSPVFTRSGTTVEAEVDGEIPSVEADPHHIEQVLVNLLLNAQRALEGRRRGRIRVTGGLAEGLPITGRLKRQVVEIRVSDNGPGIEPEDLPHIFTPFFSRFGGSGLGLPVARQLLHQHGGSLSVECPPGKGATFIVHIPLSRT